MRSNRKVFRFFRVCEVLASGLCGVSHILFFNDPNEPATREARFIIPFFGVCLLSCFGIFKCVEKHLSLTFEAISSATGFLLFLYTSIQSMIIVENDAHMISFTDEEEFNHPFFKYCRNQSIASLSTALLFLMHLCLAIDLKLDINNGSYYSDDSYQLQFELNFFIGDIWLKMKNCRRQR